LTPGVNTGEFDVDVVQNLAFTILAFVPQFNAAVTIASSSVTILEGAGTGSVPGSIALTTFEDPSEEIGVQNMTVTTSTGEVQCLALNQSNVGDPCSCVPADGACPPDFGATPPQQNCLDAGTTGRTCGNLVPGECDPVDVSGPVLGGLCNIAGLPVTSCTQPWPNSGVPIDESGCFYSLPTPIDNLARLFPDIVSSDVGGTGSAAECTGMVYTLGTGATDVDGYYRLNEYDPASGPQWLNLGGVQE